jgi:putative tryptophan/tyrosine transport system substrate-binding protein
MGQMAVSIGRRQVIAGLGSAALARPLAARAQQPAMPVIGFLNGQTAANFTYLVAAFQRGLNEQGFVDGQNVKIEYRWADGHTDRLPELAADLISRHVAVVVATGGSHVAAKAATTTIPIVASIGGDPIKLGLIASFNRPGGNFTGVSVFSSDLEAKRLELLNEIVPRGAIVGYVFDPKFEAADLERQAVETAARTIGREVRILEASSDGDLEKAFATLANAHVAGLVVGSTPLFNSLRDHVLALSARLKLPAVYEIREFVVAGGLMSYGPNVPEVYRQIGVYAGRVLKGERPADLPVLLPTKFDTAINLRTAKALGLDVPTSILLRADEVIE